MDRSVYLFGGGAADGDAGMKDLLGVKGANLAEMSRLGLSVPPGFTITTAVAGQFLAEGRLPADVREEVVSAVAHLEVATGRRLGDPERPLLVSVRSGARAPMPGMMDTVLNLGLNAATAAGIARETGDQRFALDLHRRFVAMYGEIVLGIHRDAFEGALEKVRAKAAKARGIPFGKLSGEELRRRIPDSELGLCDLKELVSANLAVVEAEAERAFPDDVEEQLFCAVCAVFSSWNTRRARNYRRLYAIPEDWGTACSVQVMVFGNRGENSGTGIAVTRDPGTGESALLGRWLRNAQGEDVTFAGRGATPLSLAERSPDETSFEEAMPEAYADLRAVKDTLEKHYGDGLELEFTVEEGRLYVLQCGPAKRSPRAAVRVAVDFAKDGVITKEQAVLRIEPSSLEKLLHPTLDPAAPKVLLARGMPASPGAASGVVVFAGDEAVRQSEAGRPVILVRAETSPDDMHGMKAARGILTSRGGMTSHAAVVARGMGKCCVSGCSAISIDHERRSFRVRVTEDGGASRAVEVFAGDFITLDGTTGCVYLGRVPTADAELRGEFGELMAWADEFRRLKVRANADIPSDARTARGFGAEGIGLCRTEHMFFEKERIPSMVEMIMAADKPARERALARLLPFQKDDFAGLFREMRGWPVIIRLLDPPLHEFLPRGDEEVGAIAKHLGVSAREVLQRAAELDEHNPMLGHRGCRLAITYPEIYEMQVRAILSAAIQVRGEGIQVIPEIMIPLVLAKTELDRLRALVDRVAELVFAELGERIEYKYGTMIELPRAALVADELATQAEFFSFGTNDLTQTVLGVSRDDAGRFLSAYVDQGVLPVDPFQSIDLGGVGALLRVGVEKGRATRHDIEIGVCGEHGADPMSIRFFHELGLDYISCSPFRVPIARLAAAQAALGGRTSLWSRPV